MIYTDLVEVKKVLDINTGDSSEDIKLAFFIEYASSLISEVLNRPNLALSLRTEFYAGTGTQKLLLRSRPVFTSPTPQVYVDIGAYYGSATNAFTASNSQLTYGSGFCLEIDQGDGSSRSGILVRINNFWEKPSVRQEGYLSPFIGPAFGNVKVIYTAGYTVDTLPGVIRAACNLLVARMRYLFPLGMELTSESYEDRHILLNNRYRDYFLSLLKPMLWSCRNWKW